MGSLLSMTGNAHLAVESIKRLRMKEILDLFFGHSPGQVPINTLHWARNVPILSDLPVNFCDRQLVVLGMSVAGAGSCTLVARADGCGCGRIHC